MPIQFPDPPKRVADAIGAHRRPSWTRPLRRLQALGGAPEPTPTIPAQPVFTVGLDELLGSGPAALDAERTASGPPSWRYSHVGADGQPEVLELAGEKTGSPVATGNDRFSPLIREALAVAGEDERVRDHDYEARLFRVPALSLLALWLHAQALVDLFVPVGHTPAGLESRVYSDDEFMSALREAAAGTKGAYEQAEHPDQLGS